MISSILAEAASESGKVSRANSLSLARTVICVMVAFTTVPSNLGCETFLGLMVLTTMGTAVSMAVSAAAAAIGAGSWAWARVEEKTEAARTRPARTRARWKQKFIPRRQ